MKSAVIVFPGSNCDRDLAVALRDASGVEPRMVWHKDSTLPEGLDLIAVPGGFSFGDYLRCGAIAAHSPIMREVVAFAGRGGHVLGICNGFQVLIESGLLPGVLMRNSTLKFVCRDVSLRVEEAQSAFTRGYSAGQEVVFPVAHHDGCYVADDDVLKRIEGENRIAFRYRDAVNGSMNDIAGILSENRRVLGMMPHPERAADAAVLGTDGRAMFDALSGMMADA
jgi:phosphoribosylformylglycinamidine synthase